MRIRLFLASCMMIILPARIGHAKPEFITAPAEVYVKIRDNDYAKAREEAISGAFKSAVHMALAGLITSSEMASRRDALESMVIERGSDFVKSYKFLEETVDKTKGYLKVRLQITLYLDDIRSSIRRMGVRAKKRSFPKLVILIDEKNMRFFGVQNLLLLKSYSEEILTQFFRDRGYRVVSRKAIMEAGLEKTAIKALKMDQRAIALLASAMESDLALIGRANIDSRRAPEGEEVNVDVSVSMFIGDGGVFLSTFEKTGYGLFKEALEGSLSAIRLATEKVASELYIQVPRTWKKVMENSNG